MRIELRAFGSSTDEILDQLGDMVAAFGAKLADVRTGLVCKNDLDDLSKEFVANCSLVGSAIVETCASGARTR